MLKRTDADGKIVWIPADVGNRDYAEFLSLGEEVAPYVEPPKVEPKPSPIELLEARLVALELEYQKLKSSKKGSN